MKFPFQKGKKMTDVVENLEPEQSIQETIPTYEELKERINELETMLKEEELRSLANEQNLRRRFQEELQNAHKFAAQKFATEMLTVKDYLEMALQDQSGNFEALKMGVSMTLNELKKAFETTQIQEIQAEQGSAPDPHRHQIMQEVESNEHNAGNIVSILKKGYTLHDRILRPSIVTVAKAQSSRDSAQGPA